MRVLVVDDERDMKTLFEQRFRKEIKNGEMNFEFACSGEEALAFMERHNHEAVLILSDINMPGMTGLELLNKIRHSELQPQPVVMMITAYGDEDNHKRAIDLGADDFLTKPIDFATLKAKLKTLLT